MAGTRMLQRRGSAAEWAAANPILGDGEVGLVKDETTGSIIDLKVGDGLTAWNDIPSRFLLKALFDAKGDLIVGSGPDGVITLPAGATGTHLEVQPDGTLSWVPMPPFALAADVAATYETLSDIATRMPDKTSTSDQVFSGALKAPAVYDNGNRVYSLSNPPPGVDTSPYATTTQLASVGRKWTRNFLMMGA